MVDLDQQFSVQIRVFFVGINTNQGAPLLFFMSHPSLWSIRPRSLFITRRTPETGDTTPMELMELLHTSFSPLSLKAFMTPLLAAIQSKRYRNITLT